MWFRSWFGACGLTGALLLLAGGCSSVDDTQRARQSQSLRANEAKQPDTRSEEERARAHAHYATGLIHELNGETEAALEEYSQAARLDPRNEWLTLEVTRRLLHAKQPEKALELLQQAANQPGAGGEIYARLGLVYSQLGRQEEALQASKIAVRKAPKSLSGYHNMFVVLAQTKQAEAAFKVLNDAANQSGAEPEFLVGLSELYLTLGTQFPELRTNSNQKALAVLNRAAETSTVSVSLQIKMADSFIALGQPEKAADVYVDLLKRLPDIPGVREHVHAKLAEIYLQAKDNERAAQQLEAVVKRDPTNPQAYLLLGNLALENKKPDEAAEHFSKAVLLKPDFEPAYYELASAQLAANQPSKALATLAEARKKFSGGFLLEMMTAMAFSQEKAYAEALRHYTAAEVVARATDPSRLNHIFYFQTGAAYERNGQYAEAERCFRKTLQLSPDFPEALNYLGYMWAERGENLDEAREMLEKAVKAEPKNAAYLDSLAWVLFKLNQTEPALKYILEAVANLEEPDATVYDHLGDIYAAVGQKQKAREAWSKSVSLEPNDQVKKKLQDAP